MGTAKTIARNTTFNFIATVSDIAINLAVGIMLARSLGTEQYGLYSLLMWFLGLAIIIVNLGLGDMAKRFVAEAIGQQNSQAPRSIVRLTLTLRGLAALVISVVIMVFSRYWAGLFGEPSHQILFVFVALALMPNVLNFALVSIFAGFQKYEYGAYLILGTNPLRAVMVIILMTMGFGIQAVLLLNMAIWVLGVFIGIFLLRRLIPLNNLLSPPPLESAARKRALKYALTMAGVFGVNYFLWSQAEVMFLGLYRPVEEVGFYTLASKLPVMAMHLIPMVFGAVLLPVISEQFGRGDMEKIRRIYLTSTRYLMILALLLATAGIALARPIISLLYGADYAPVIALMQILFIPFAMLAIGHGATAVIYGTNQPAFVFKVGLVLAFLNIGLSLWLIPIYGMTGAAIGSSIPRLLALPLYIRFVSSKIGAAWPLGNSLKIVAAALLVGLALFFLQTQLSTVLALALSVPVGLVLYAAAILALRVIHPQDLVILKGMQDYLPLALRKPYATLISLAERMVRTNHAP